MSNSRRIPGASSTFAQVMSEIVLPPVVEISNMDITDSGHENIPKSDKHGHHEEGMMVQGLHHCYKVEGGHCLTSFRCNHDHTRVSNGHLEEISKNVSNSPLTRRRMSIASSGPKLLSPEEELFRSRANSDSNRRRSCAVATTPNLHRSQGKNSPVISPAPRRRGSNVVLQSDELHYVYDQYLANKTKH